MRVRVALLLVVSLLSVASVRAQAPADPLRLVPKSVDLIAKIEDPRVAYDAIVGHEVFQELLQFEVAKVAYDTTNFRRSLQILGYFEKELGHDRLELLDKLTGGGVVLGARFSDKSNRVLLVIQAKDEKLLTRFVHVTRKVVDEELARQGNKERVQAKKYRKLEVLQLGPQVNVAQARSALLFANAEAALHKAIDLHLDGPKDSAAQLASLAEAKKLLPNDLLAWVALNLEQVRQIPDVKNSLNTLGLEPITLFSIGGVVDVVKRAPFVCLGLARDGKNFHARIAMPRGRDGMSSLAAMVLPTDEGGSLPMLQPPRAQSCTSYFIDLSKFWGERHKILTKEQAVNLDKFEKDTAKYLGKMSLGSLLQMTGKYHRIVTAQQGKSPYAKAPPQLGGAFAAVLDMRDPEFAKAMNTILRGAALALTFQYGLKMVEEKHAGHTLVAYYLSETRKVEGDPDGIRFNFSPCFTHVGDQFVISSTVELGRDMIDCLKKEKADGISPATSRSELYAKGVGDNLRAAEDFLLTEVILSQALPAGDARKELKRFIDLVENLGVLRAETHYGKSDFRFDARWQYKN